MWNITLVYIKVTLQKITIVTNVYPMSFSVYLMSAFAFKGLFNGFKN